MSFQPNKCRYKVAIKNVGLQYSVREYSEVFSTWHTCTVSSDTLKMEEKKKVRKEFNLNLTYD